MKKILLAIFAMTTLLVACNKKTATVAQATSSETTSTAAEVAKQQAIARTQLAPAKDYTPKTNALLWQIDGKELKKPSFLYGTIHMIAEDDFYWPKGTKEAFAKADRVTFEINMEEMTNIGSQMALLSKAMMADGLTLKDLLSEKDYNTVQAHFQKIGMPLFLFERMKPMFLTVLASEDMAKMQAGQSDNSIVSYEFQFVDLAKSADKEMEFGGLETAEYQMSMFDSIPYKVQAEMLVDGIKAEQMSDDSENAAEAEFDIMVDMYKRQDITAMQAMISGEDSGYADYEELLLVNRNKNWIPVMGTQMKDKPTFFAVGAGHLGGPNGVIQLLENEGYTLTPLSE